jgi:hypothetical protein
MPIREVFAVNSPAQWLTDATRLELEAQGASIAENEAVADVVVRGTLRYAFLDLYMATWVHLVLDLTTATRGLPPKEVRLHVSDGWVAWSGSDSELYGVFCSTEQKLQRYVIDAIARAAADLDQTPPAL